MMKGVCRTIFREDLKGDKMREGDRASFLLLFEETASTGKIHLEKIHEGRPFHPFLLQLQLKRCCHKQIISVRQSTNERHSTEVGQY